MLVVTILMIIAWWLIILLYAFAMQVIPLKNYSKNIATVQIFLSSASIILGLFTLFYIRINYDSGVFIGTDWSEKWVSLMMLFFFISLVLSLFRLYSEKKINRNKIETILLRAEEYKIVKKFDFVMGDYFYSPNVKAYCEFDRGVMAFTGGMPNKEVDCYFTCRKVKDGIYECISFEPLMDVDKTINFSKVKKIIFLVLAAIYFALLMIDNSKKFAYVSKLVESLTWILFGSALFGIVKGTEGLMAKIMLVFSVIVIICGVSCLF